MKLRDYQLEACLAACREWDAGRKRVLLTLATGLGKTVIFAELSRLMVNQGKRVLVIAPSIELVGQAAGKIQRVTGVRPAIEQAENWSNEDGSVRSPVVVSCKASLVSRMRDGRRRFERLREIGLVVIDEAHYAATADYRDIVEHFDCLTLGVTATPRRHDGEALGKLFDVAPFTMGIREGIDQGWLVGCTAHCLQLQSLDLGPVKTQGGDFVASQLGRAMEGDDVVFEVAAATAAESEGRKTIVFCVSVDQAIKTTQVLKEHHGIRAEFVCGDKSRCTDSQREAVLGSFQRDPKGVQVVCNVGVLTTGFDFPGLQHIVMARPTKSTPLFTQIFGRGTRALDGVVDFPESTPASRRAAIAASGKPTWKFTDLRDMSLKHELVTPVDVLGGSLSDAARARVKKALEEANEARDIDEVIQEVEAKIHAEAEAERARLAKLRAEAAFKRVTHDPFLEAFRVTHESAPKRERGARMPFGKYKGQLVRDVPRSYLAWLMREAKPKQGWLLEAIKERIQTVEV